MILQNEIAFCRNTISITTRQRNHLHAYKKNNNVKVTAGFHHYLHYNTNTRRKKAPSREMSCRIHSTLKNREDCDMNPNDSQYSSRKIAIIGGGLAGLSTTWNLLQLLKTSSSSSSSPLQQQQQTSHEKISKITVFDKSSSPGMEGASSIAGGLLHPLTPKGNSLVHLGLEGLEASNLLIEKAIQATEEQNQGKVKSKERIINKEYLYRIALTEKHKQDLQKTNQMYPEFTSWVDSSDLLRDIYDNKHKHDKGKQNNSILGGLKLHGGCKVINVPNYLRGLWLSCQSLSSSSLLPELEWTQLHTKNEEEESKMLLDNYDTIILTAGSGLFQDEIISQSMVPVDLVRGQSIKLSTINNDHDSNDFSLVKEALLCGKYIIPQSSSSSMIVGSTQEYSDQPFPAEQVIDELKEKTTELYPDLWSKNGINGNGEYDNIVVDNIRSAYRVNSARTQFGRMPIVGKLDFHSGEIENNENNDNGTALITNNSIMKEQKQKNEKDIWIFSGLSGRGKF